MSTTYYNQQWEGSIAKLLQNIGEENVPLDENRGEKGITHKRSDYEWFQYYGALYIRYLDIYRQLEDAFDQAVHPQKRTLMGQMLENVMVRMCEVKQNAIKYTTHLPNPQTDYLNLDDMLYELKLTPKALSVPLPRHFLDPTPRDRVLQEIHKDLGVSEETEVVADTVALDTNLETAIRIIQKLERGRQGIMRGLAFAKARNKIKDRNREVANEEDRRTILIQKYWRAFLARRELHKIRQEELKFLGIEKEPVSKSLLEQAEKQREHLKEVQRNRAEKFEDDQDLIIDQIKKTEEPSIKQRMLDERRKWIKKFMEMHEFGNVPNKAADFYKQQEEGAEKEEPKGKGAKGKDKDSKESKGSKKNEVDKFLEEHTAVGPTETVLKMQQNINQYTETWGEREDTDISDEPYDKELAKDAVRPGIEEELEKLVDSMINLELDGMRVKYGIKKKKEKKARKPKKKAKKIKIPQGLGKRSPRDLLEELYEKNIAKMLAPAKLESMLGEHNTVTHLVEKTSEQLPDPSIQQVRNIVSEYVGLPLGSQEAKDKLEKWGWFMFYGGMGVGKTLAIRGLQHQTNAVVFDLTPENVRERYTEKSELVRLIWSVIISAKEFQPSIIMLDDFETIFSGAKTKKKDPSLAFAARMKKIVGDLKKNKLWSKNDRIAVIGCSNKPYDATMKDCKKLFDKKIYFPYPNYATRKLIISRLIEDKVGKAVPFPYETFAQVTEGFTPGSFKHCVEKVLTPLRILRLKDEPLRLSEFISPLSGSICVFAGEYEKFRKFTDDVTGLRERKEAKKETVEEKKNDRKPNKK